MDIAFADELLEELGCSSDPIEPTRPMAALFKSHDIPNPRTVSDLDIGLYRSAREARIIYSPMRSVSGDEVVVGTVSGMVRDRIMGCTKAGAYRNRLLKSMQAGERVGEQCSRCGACLLSKED